MQAINKPPTRARYNSRRGGAHCTHLTIQGAISEVDHIPIAAITPSSDFLEICAELEVSLYSHTMGRDYHG